MICFFPHAETDSMSGREPLHSQHPGHESPAHHTGHAP